MGLIYKTAKYFLINETVENKIQIMLSKSYK